MHNWELQQGNSSRGSYRKHGSPVCLKRDNLAGLIKTRGERARRSRFGFCTARQQTVRFDVFSVATRRARVSSAGRHVGMSNKRPGQGPA